MPPRRLTSSRSQPAGLAKEASLARHETDAAMRSDEPSFARAAKKASAGALTDQGRAPGKGGARVQLELPPREAV